MGMFGDSDSLQDILVTLKLILQDSQEWRNGKQVPVRGTTIVGEVSLKRSGCGNVSLLLQAVFTLALTFRSI